MTTTRSPRVLRRAILVATALTAVPALAERHGQAPPLGSSLFEFDSAVATHRRHDEEIVPEMSPTPDERDGAASAEGDAAMAEGSRDELATPTPAPVVKRAGDRPPPIEPATALASMESDAAADRERALERFGFDSVLDTHTAYDEVDGPSWIEANRRVGEIGGWRTYARELFEASQGEDDEAIDESGGGESMSSPRPEEEPRSEAGVDGARPESPDRSAMAGGGVPRAAPAAGTPEREVAGSAASDPVERSGWIAANDRVGEIGGWRTYARELFESSSSEGEGEAAGTERP